MQSWNCCRTCMKAHNLHPIFMMLEHIDKYSEVVFLTTGVRISQNDTLPLEICSTCINFINESIKFRRKCEQIQKQLLENKPNGLKVENSLKDDPISIDISDILNEDFKEFDNNLTFNNDSDNSNEATKDICDTIDIDEKPLVILNGKKRRVSRKVSKTENEKVREEIQCEYCHKILTSKFSLRNHYKIHTGFDVICEHCGKKFITRRLLLMHCRAKHGYEKTDKCSYCDYKASNAEQVKIHERLHTGEKPFVCKECNAGFHRKSSYLQHVAIHLPEKTVQCDQCPARFKSVTLMRIHKNRHRPSPYTFKCGVCDNSFARRRNVARHLQRVHGLPPENIHRIRVH